MFKRRLSVIWLILRSDAKRLWYALIHRQTPAWFKVGVVAVALYLLSPFDLIPDVLLVLGLVDDIVLAPLVLRWLFMRLPVQIREYANARANGASTVTRSR